MDHDSRIAIVAGMRTPFTKAFTTMATVSAAELGTHAAVAALNRLSESPCLDLPAQTLVDELIMGNVAGPADAANIARVIALKSGLPEHTIAHTVNRNCGSGMESILQAATILRGGRAEIVIAGGTESMSNVPLLFNAPARQWMMQMGRARTFAAKLKTLSRWRPQMLRPVAALELGLTDAVCGLNMGQTAEALAEEFSISREDQDAFALQSHQRAYETQQSGFFSGEIAPWNANHQTVAQDNGPRPNQSLEQLAKLRPIFAPKGSVTAGNSCQLTDGAAAVLLMTEASAKRRGFVPVGYITATAIAGCSPARMGLGPVFAIAKLLDQQQWKLDRFELFEINEAFAAQVLACLQALGSAAFAEKELNRSTPVGEIPQTKLNIHGGAIALGHPVGSTGTRLVLTLLRTLNKFGLHRGLASLCIGGGQGMAMAVETAGDN
ncbi:Acetyl-CoA acetyltransferase [Roseimaritima multifibrata]|uniref:Acetyl-CoA acetyltransferase n=1 Tax=Roseimaritima multifibrata TaxID=1930274 RepID=A0A517MKD5_9BACT|nr:thiolase family protein [Roseimaritima multifibrata]QDS95334.1 Acetyl-CoA acetyltransferase [Roseimaritima multifibrata]